MTYVGDYEIKKIICGYFNQLINNINFKINKNKPLTESIKVEKGKKSIYKKN